MTRVTIALHFVLLLTGPAYADQPARSGWQRRILEWRPPHRRLSRRGGGDGGGTGTGGGGTRNAIANSQSALTVVTGFHCDTDELNSSVKPADSLGLGPERMPPAVLAAWGCGLGQWPR
jgi:hypothetical protein